jgi:class 3 adenylate cyclase
MFIDLIDSSPLAERFDPEVMRQVLGQFHRACVSAIEAHDGHIAQYSGDGLLVYFGYPLAHEDDAVRAVLAGLGVIANLGLANEHLETEHKVRLQVRLGIETGLVVAGEVGAGSARDRQAIVGEAPIVAARLQTLAPPNTVVIGPATERLIQGSFVLESMGARELKGVSEPIEVYRVLSRSDSVNSFEVREGRGLTPMIGRGAELEMLRQRWSQSCDGEMRCVLLTGEPGIGKSRTLRAFRDSIADDEHEVISFHCSPYNRDSPFWPVLQRLQRSFELDAKAYTEADVDRLEAALSGFGIDTAEAAVVLSNLFGMPTAGRYPQTG